MKLATRFFVLILVFGMMSFATEGKLSGYVFGDSYFISSNHNADIEGRNGLWLRRAYLGYDTKFSDNWSSRLRLEMATADGLNGNAGKAEPVVKDAYLTYKKGDHKIVFGISGTPTWGLLEKHWGYRSVEKTPQDLQKWGSSRDFGIAFKGKFSSKVKYHFMFGNGNSNKSENNDGKKFMFSLDFKPTKSMDIEISGDWNDKGSSTWTTTQIFIGHKTKDMRFGLMYSNQERDYDDGDTVDLSMASLYFVKTVNKKWNMFARVDRMFDANPDGHKISYLPFDNTAKSTFFVLGADYKALKNIHFMPNVEYVKYDENLDGLTPDSDLVIRITFYYKF